MNGNFGLGRFGAIGALALSLVLGFAGGWGWQATGLGRSTTEEVVRNYILDHPEILPEAMQRLQDREVAKRIEPLRETLQTPYQGAVLGNPKGSVILVEFADYVCPYCKTSVADVEALIAANDDLMVVLRQDPVLSPESDHAARMALAAADQGKFPAFHKLMYSKDHVSPETIEAAAREAGVDVAKARADISAGKFEFELSNNRRLATTIGFSGTPSWVIGNQAFSGAVGQEALAKALEKARES
jgi:protein-disulfide isomerase